MTDYDARMAAELRTFAEQEVVHDLPQIHHFWTHRFLVPLLAEVGLPTSTRCGGARSSSSAGAARRSGLGWSA
jgi:hypothetical protein